MPEMDGLEATRRIMRRARTETRVLILTTFDLDEYVFDALRAGASGFLLKDTLPDELLAAVHGSWPTATRCSRRRSRAASSSSSCRSPRPRPRRAATPALDTLTDREREVLAAVARGLSNAEIAEELFMSHATAKTHVSRLLTKLDGRDRAQLVMLAYESGVVVPGGQV